MVVITLREDRAVRMASLSTLNRTKRRNGTVRIEPVVGLCRRKVAWVEPVRPSLDLTISFIKNAHLVVCYDCAASSAIFLASRAARRSRRALALALRASA